jgi:DNA-binding MarR family transcriptional regulator
VVIEESQELLVAERLQVLGVELLSEWDALVFLYHHPASLCTTAQIATLVGYDKTEIGAALHRLEALGFILRSRVFQGIRFYRFLAPKESARRSCLLELMNLAQNRGGRLLLIKHLKRTALEPRPKRDSGLRLA